MKMLKQTTVFTMREFLRNSRRASALIRRGQKITVTNNGVPFFTAVPEKRVKEDVTLADFAHLKMKGVQDKNLSKDIDKLVYES